MTPLTCAELETRHVEAHYLAGRISAEEAVAYEAHYFACDRCWALLRRATEARAAFAAPSPVSARRFLPWGLALAAVITAVMLIRGLPEEPAAPAAPAAAPPAAAPPAAAPAQPAAPVHREVPSQPADTTSITLTGRRTRDTLAAAWERVPAAATYRLRLFTPDGMLLLERETTDTSLALASASARLPREGSAFWQVRALGLLGLPLAQSGLTAVGPSTSRAR